MARNTSFSLGDHFTTFIDERVASGRYASASDVVRAGLRILEAEERQLEALQRALIEGEESGPSLELDVDRFLRSMRGRAMVG